MAREGLVANMLNHIILVSRKGSCHDLLACMLDCVILVCGQESKHGIEANMLDCYFSELAAEYSWHRGWHAGLRHFKKCPGKYAATCLQT